MWVSTEVQLMHTARPETDKLLFPDGTPDECELTEQVADLLPSLADNV